MKGKGKAKRESDGKGKAKREADATANRTERMANRARKRQSFCAEKNLVPSSNVPAVDAPILSHLSDSKLPCADTSAEAPNADAEENNVPAPIPILPTLGLIFPCADTSDAAPNADDKEEAPNDEEETSHDGVQDDAKEEDAEAVAVEEEVEDEVEDEVEVEEVEVEEVEVEEVEVEEVVEEEVVEEEVEEVKEEVVAEGRGRRRSRRSR